MLQAAGPVSLLYKMSFLVFFFVYIIMNVFSWHDDKFRVS